MITPQIEEEQLTQDEINRGCPYKIVPFAYTDTQPDGTVTEDAAIVYKPIDNRYKAVGVVTEYGMHVFEGQKLSWPELQTFQSAFSHWQTNVKGSLCNPRIN